MSIPPAGEAIAAYAGAMKSGQRWFGVMVISVLLAGCSWQQPSGVVTSDETFRQRVLDCPALPLPGKRMPTCDVALDRLRASGDQACTWLEEKPSAVDYNRYDYWNDPFDISNVGWDFANASRDSRTVPLALERSERTIVASMAWRYLCPELGDRYNLPPEPSGD